MQLPLPPTPLLHSLLQPTMAPHTTRRQSLSLSLSFRRKLEIEREWLGSVVLKVIPAYTSSQHGKGKVGGRTFGHSEIHTSRLQQKIKTFSYCCPKSYQQNLWNILCTISVFEIRYGMSLAARFHVLLVFPSLYFVLRREKRVLGRRPLGTRRWPKALRSSSADGIGGYQGEGEERGGWIRTGWRSTNSARGRRIARGGGRGRYKGGKLATEKGKGV